MYALKDQKRDTERWKERTRSIKSRYSKRNRIGKFIKLKEIKRERDKRKKRKRNIRDKEHRKKLKMKEIKKECRKEIKGRGG